MTQVLTLDLGLIGWLDEHRFDKRLHSKHVGMALPCLHSREQRTAKKTSRRPLGFDMTWWHDLGFIGEALGLRVVLTHQALGHHSFPCAWRTVQQQVAVGCAVLLGVSRRYGQG